MTDWKDTLAPTPDCVDLSRLGGTLSDAERAHVVECVRCQTELALLRDVMNEEISEESRWIANELAKANNVAAFRPRSRNVWYAAAAAIVMIIGASWLMQLREPAIDVTPGGVYRSGRLELLAPVGDVAHAPNELRWEGVPQATRYEVRVLEVDATVVWSGGTTEARAALPPDVVVRFAPGKSLKWDVRAFRGNEMLASSETQTFRVIP